jgi:polysaccharide biosynthesis protein PslG
MRALAWLLCCTLLLTLSLPAAAQDAPENAPQATLVDDASPPAGEPAPPATDESPVPGADDPVAPPADAVRPAPDVSAGQPASARPGFPYGVLVADIGNAPRAREAGFRVMATTVSWKRTEPSRGQFPFEHTDQWGQTAPNDVTNVITAARNNGMQFGFRLIDPPDWAGGTPARVEPADLEDYVYHVVRYAHDSLAYFELFNEQNLPSEWGAAPDPAGYARLMAAAYRGAKRADPSVPVISAGPSQRTGGRGGSMEDVDWLDRFLSAGGGASVDAVGVHAYMGSFDASVDPSCSPLCFGQVQEFRAVMDRHADSGPMYITEFGALEDTPIDLGQYNWMKLPSDARAEHLVNALRAANADYPWMAGATMFNLDYAAAAWIPATSEQSWFSLLNPDKSPRPAFLRIQQARQSGDLP